MMRKHSFCLIATLSLEYRLGEANAEHGVDLDATKQVDPIAHLATGIGDILGKIDAIVGVEGWCAAPEHSTGIERYMPIVTVLNQSATIAKAEIRLKRV